MSIDEKFLTQCYIAEMSATRGPWKWATSNSWRRLEGPDTAANGELMSRTLMVIEPFVSRVDGHPNLTVSEEDMNFISIARDAMPRLIEEVRRLRRVIFTGGAMYRMERAAMGIPGGNDEPVKIQEAFEKICPSCGHRYGDHIIPTFPKSGLECPHAGVPV